jgi:hypothetical protein
VGLTRHHQTPKVLIRLEGAHDFGVSIFGGVEHQVAASLATLSPASRDLSGWEKEETRCTKFACARYALTQSNDALHALTGCAA